MSHKPYYYKTNSNIGFLCIHGIFGSPNQFRQIAEMLYNCGYNCKVILLPGHGGSVDEFAKSSYNTWSDYTKEQISIMKYEYDKVILIGHSMGGLFCLDFAEEFKVDGIILINTPMKVKISATQLWVCLKVIFSKKNTTRKFTQTYEQMYSMQKGTWYEYIKWIKPLLGVVKLILNTRKIIPTITIPTLAIQSKKDETVNYKSILYFKNKMNNKILKTRLLKNSYHCYFSTEDKKITEELIKKFVKNI
ncbi:hypothetical protein AN639_05180 [Candidatus Epulonipiscium fishelsonii]|uniref:Uncharacterized protein n=1 Tax=Candidatus Epulonipiscium fishelsonii TaxID=77094 RepID=A0ACC8XAN7_9FIRM|nr:hypothetical protein AN396_08075 [Epulopiscium sp. SCG-B11WGA-EpuloA1]ONI40098.1 hypothetical protein AN639_05180 [Epulopiscium sp. SCG-B05WGA-EpuloA1]